MRGRRERFQGWSKIDEVDRDGRERAEARDWEGLWRLILDAPVADAVRLARRLRGWSPPRPAERELLDRLLAVDERLAARVVVVTDARIEHVLARTSGPMPHGDAHEPAFTGWGDVIVTGSAGGLSRWSATQDGGLVLRATAEAPRLGSLVSIPAWEVIGGRAHGEGRHYFYHPRTLAPVGQPAAFLQGRYRPEWVHAITASADGRRVAVGGQLLVDSEDSLDFVMATYNLDHPLAPALLSLSTLARGGPVPRTFSGAEMVRYGLDTWQVIDLVRAFVQHHPDHPAT